MSINTYLHMVIEVSANAAVISKESRKLLQRIISLLLHVFSNMYCFVFNMSTSKKYQQETKKVEAETNYMGLIVSTGNSSRVGLS